MNHSRPLWKKALVAGFTGMILELAIPFSGSLSPAAKQMMHSQVFARDYYAQITLVYSHNITGKLIPGQLTITNPNTGQVVYNNHINGSATISVRYTSVDDKRVSPNDYHLSQNYPNPFADQSSFDLNVPRTENIEVVIYDILGRTVLEKNETVSEGEYQFSVGGLASGIYLTVVKTGDKVLTKKMVSIGENGKSPWMNMNYSAGSSNNELSKTADVPDERNITFTPDDSPDPSGYERDIRNVVIAGNDTLKYKLTRSNNFAVKVSDKNGNPLNGAIINVKGEGVDIDLMSEELTLLNSGTYTLRPVNMTGNGLMGGQAVVVTRDTLKHYLLNAKMLEGIVFGVNADSMQENQRLSNAAVWVGTRNLDDVLNDPLYTNADGKYTLLFSPTGKDTLFIQAEGHHQRNMLVGAETPTTMDQYVITDKMDIDFFNYVAFNEGLHGIVKPSDKWGDTLPFYFVNPNTTPLDSLYMAQAVVDTLYKFSGGKYRGVVVPDSSNMYGKVEWYRTDGNGSIGFTYDPNDRTIIDWVRIGIKRYLSYEPSLRDVTMKEGINVFNFADIIGKNADKVPEHWKKSLFYQGIENSPQTSLPEIDLMAGRIAGGLPRGYKINIIHLPQLEFWNTNP